ncbi:MAG TPA: dihydroorotase [Phnomibacter sp.]|nr:dihydroorotase [Phnomibacter sp.]
MAKYIIRNIRAVNEGKTLETDVLVCGGRIKLIAGQIEVKGAAIEIDGTGKYLLPGAIDDQVHFREPGLTHKATIGSEARAAVAGGVTSFMEMPNTVPNALTQQLLEDKYEIASRTSLANYSFFMGTSNDNADEVLRTNEKKQDICGIKIFMGSSTGNMLVDNYRTLDKIFSEAEVLIATHCEDERVIRKNLQNNEGITFGPEHHPVLRDVDACFESSFSAIQLAKMRNTRLHILHISTARELQLFTNMLPLKDKRITAEVCVHHLHFSANDYEKLGYRIKCNPAIKGPEHRDALWEALLDDRLDIIATDHAPHTMDEKGIYRDANNVLQNKPEGINYEHAHAGLPLVQHSLPLMMQYVKQGKISIEKVVEKMSHAVADCFQIAERGYLREGYFADLAIVDMDHENPVDHSNILYKCGWSPLEGMNLPLVTHTFVSGNLVYDNGVLNEAEKGMRMRFDR